MEERSKRPEVPETASAAFLLLPPSLPPAPPGTGAPPPPPPGAPGPGGEGDDRFLKELLGALGGFAVMRTTFETLDCFPDDPELTAELRSFTCTARDEILRVFRSLTLSLTKEYPVEDLRLDRFRYEMERLAAEGIATRWADSFHHTDVFHRANPGASAPPRRYWFRRGRHDDERRTLPSSLYCARLMEDLIQALTCDDTLIDRDALEDVFRDYLVIVSALYLCTDPMPHFHHRED